MSDVETWAKELWTAYRGAAPWHALPESERDTFRAMARVVARTVAQEREACAAIAAAEPGDFVADLIAEKIRARG